MRISFCCAVVVMLCAVVAGACGSPPKVVQGIVVSYETASKTLTVKDERPPQQELVFSLQGAEIGADPAPKDQVRLAYRDEGGSLVATRVMNLTRQKELRSSGGGH